MKADHFANFESHIQRLIEGGFARLFAGRLHPREVIIQLAQAMEDEAFAGATEALIAPVLFVVWLNPHDHHEIIKTEPDLPDQLVQELIELAHIAGMILPERPQVQVLADATMPPHAIQVRAKHPKPNDETGTQSMLIEAEASHLTEGPDAYLKLLDERRIPLQDAVINLGRHRDNTIILDDKNVSRHHAQIRLRFGRYILFDLNSRAGTQVNGKKIHEITLQPGDVIEFANQRMVYMENSSNTFSLHDTQSLPAPEELTNNDDPH